MISTGCGNEGTATLLGSESGPLASSTRYWYIDNKGLRVGKMFGRFPAVGFFVELFASSTRRTYQGIQLE